MKNLLIFLLLVMSLLASGQSNSQSIEVEIKYWKSIAESNDTVAYREYLQRYGEDGLYKDEAITRIALLKTSGKQAQSNSIECCFYSQYGSYNIEYVVRFDAEQNKTWLKPINYDTVRSNLAVSRDFYENQAVLSTSRESFDKKNTVSTTISGGVFSSPYDRSNKRKQKREVYFTPQIVSSVRYSPDYYKYKYAWTTDEEYEYAPMKSTSSRDVYFKRDNLHEIERLVYHDERHSRRTYDGDKTFYVYSDDVYNDEYYNGKDGLVYMKGYSRCKKTKTMQGYRYIAFSKDKSSFIMWFEEDENLDGKIYEKRNYSQIPKEDLLPKKVNYDFLNE